MRSLFQIFQQFNLMKLIEFARFVFYDQKERDHLIKMRSIESHSLHLTKIDISDNHNDLIDISSYKTQRDCLSQCLTKRWRHAWSDLIWFDLIWFDLIWSDLIWFDSIEALLSIIFTIKLLCRFRMNWLRYTKNFSSVCEISKSCIWKFEWWTW